MRCLPTVSLVMAALFAQAALAQEESQTGTGTEDQSKSEAETPPTTQPAAMPSLIQKLPNYMGGWDEREYLTGDWGGARTELAKHAILFDISATHVEINDTAEGFWIPTSIGVNDKGDGGSATGFFESQQPFPLCSDLGLEEEPASQPDVPPEEGETASHSETLAKKLSNPISDLISVPLQSNFNLGGGVDIPSFRGPRALRWLFRHDSDRRRDFGRPRLAGRVAERLLRFGLHDDRDQAFRYLLNVQPVIPISLNEEWNVISRTIIPFIAQDDVIGTSSQGGMGDITQSLFFSPKSGEPFIWGVGPVFYLPTATDDSLGAERWGMGPTGVILKQTGPWTMGMLANHIWSFARDDDRKEINSTFLQPFLAYNFKTATTISFNTESTYDWIDDQWSVPLFAGVGQIVKVGKLPVQFQLGSQYWVEGPDSAPDWSVRFQMTFLFPK